MLLFDLKPVCKRKFSSSTNLSLLQSGGLQHIPYPQFVIKDKEDVFLAFCQRSGSTRRAGARAGAGARATAKGVFLAVASERGRAQAEVVTEIEA
jgi:hypothetical protein